ncbi:MAG: oligosaccharide flippase family protein [Bacteroidales bacterium]|nr:oligosaccharide flippase family protein [Bacteroidales bacterium]
MALLKSLAGQTLIYGLGTIVPRLLNYLLLTPFYTRIFPKAEYGSLTILYTYVAFLLVFLTYGMETTFFRFISTEKNKSTIFSTSVLSLLFTTLPFVALLIFFNDQLAVWMDYSANPNFILWLGLIVALDAFFAIPFAQLRQDDRAIWFTTIKLVNITINIGLNYLFLYVMRDAYLSESSSYWAQWYNPDLGVGYVLIANLTASAVVAVMLLPEFFKVKWHFDYHLWKKMMKYAMPLLVVGVAAMINEVADKLFLKHLLPASAMPEEQVGIYGANYKLAVLMTIFIQMFKYAAEPFFFKQADKSDAKETYATVMKFFVIFGISIFLGVTLFLDWIKFYIGPKYHEGLAIVPIVLLANLFLGMYYNLSLWYKLTNKTHLGAIISIVGAVFTIVVNFIFIPEYGYMASAWATFGAYGLMMILSWLWGQKYYPIHYPIGRILMYFIISLMIYYLHQNIRFGTAWLQHVMSILFWLSFVVIALFLERKQLTHHRV